MGAEPQAQAEQEEERDAGQDLHQQRQGLKVIAEHQNDAADQEENEAKRSKDLSSCLKKMETWTSIL